MEEIWKDVLGYEGFYQASNLGRVKSLDRTIIHKNGRVKFYKGVSIKLQMNKWGYLSCPLRKNGKLKLKSMQRIVWEAFNGTIPKGMQVNHINEIKTDNRLENLNLMSPKDNINWGTGISRRSASRINDKMSKEVCQYTTDNIFVRKYLSLGDIERTTGFKKQNISLACKKNLVRYGFKWRYAS